MSKRSRDKEEEEDMPAPKQARVSPEDAALALMDGFEKAAEKLVKALDDGMIKPAIRDYGVNGKIACYTIPWTEEPLKDMAAAAKVLGYDCAQSLFEYHFQGSAPSQLQGFHAESDQDDAFYFRLSYGKTWGWHKARNARLEAGAASSSSSSSED